MQNRWDIINFFIEKNNYKSYLEIGYYKGWSFDRVNCKEKVAVDPNPCKFEYQQNEWVLGGVYEEPEGLIYKIDSDKFFRGYFKPKIDIIFIDGLHEREQALRDLKNSFAWLSDGGIIIMHDCNPPKYEHTTSGIDGCWTGDVYKAMLDLRNSPEANAYTVDIDWGVGIVRPVEDLKKRDITSTQHLNAISDWDYFDINRKELLNLVDISTFVAKERYSNVKILE